VCVQGGWHTGISSCCQRLSASSRWVLRPLWRTATRCVGSGWLCQSRKGEWRYCSAGHPLRRSAMRFMPPLVVALWWLCVRLRNWIGDRPNLRVRAPARRLPPLSSWHIVPSSKAVEARERATTALNMNLISPSVYFRARRSAFATVGLADRWKYQLK
jgi:hypothetical protein